MASLGVVIQSLREDRGLTQGQLATYAGLSRSYLSLIESGQRESIAAEILVKIARRLGVTSEYLLERADLIPVCEEKDGIGNLLEQVNALARSDEIVHDILLVLVELTPERRRYVLEWVRYQQVRQIDLEAS